VNHGNAMRGGVRRRAEMNRLTAEPDFAAVIGIHTGEDLDQGTLAGAILAGQDMHLAGGEIKMHVIEDPHPGERFSDMPHFQHSAARIGARMKSIIEAPRPKQAGKRARRRHSPRKDNGSRRARWLTPARLAHARDQTRRVIGAHFL